LVQFNGSKLVDQRPTKTSKANPRPQSQPEVPADIKSTPQQQNFQPSGKQVDTDEDSDVTPFATPRALLKKTKKRVEPARKTDDEEKNKVKLVAKTTSKGQNKGNNKRVNTAISCLCCYHDLVIDECFNLL
jgi:hypothetical protein